MAWFKKARKPIVAPDKASRVPEGLWVKCPDCDAIIYQRDLVKTLSVCSKCGYHFRLTARERLLSLFDGEHWVEQDSALRSNDPLHFTDTKPYRTRLEASRKATGLADAVIVGVGRIDGIETVVAAMEYAFIGGSMGVVMGEKIVRGIETALERRLPSSSSRLGRRTDAGGRALADADGEDRRRRWPGSTRGLPYISVLTDPTTGGVTASFAMLGDLNIAEPKALIGFAGPRVIEQTIRQKLPDGFQRSEFLLERGMLDLVVDRRELKGAISRALRFMLPANAPA